MKWLFLYPFYSIQLNQTDSRQKYFFQSNNVNNCPQKHLRGRDYFLILTKIYSSIKPPVLSKKVTKHS